MGMDSVEIVLRLEEEFCISISDEEAAATRTVGDVYHLVVSRLDLTPGCLSSMAFYQTRRALTECLGLPRRSIRPTTPLAPLLPMGTRREQWQLICERIGLPIPPLRLPDSWRQRFYSWGFGGGLVLALALGGVALHYDWPAPLVFFLTLFLWIGLTVAVFKILKSSALSFVNELPADTAGELARVLLSVNYNHFAPVTEGQKPTNEDVWERIVDIFCDQLQIGREEVVPNARIVDDLGVS